MDSGVAHQTFEFQGSIHQLFYLWLAFISLLQGGRILERLGDGDVKSIGDHLGDAVHVGIGNVHGAAHVFDGGLGGHGAEGNDLGHVFAPVFAGNVVNHLAPAVHAEINVNIGQGDALGIQEALKEQLVLEGVNVGDAHGVGHQRPSR